MRAAQILAEAETCRRRGELDRAQSLCESLLKAYPDYVGALQTLGVTHLAKNNNQQALSCFMQATMLCPKDCVNLTNLAVAHLRLGAVELAGLILAEARRLNPDDANIYTTLAEARREQRNYEQAADCYRKALGLLPESAEAAHGLGDCLVQLGRLTEAEAMLKKAHRLKPSSLAILYALTQLPRSAHGIDILRALESVRKDDEQDQEEFDTFLAFTRAAGLDRQGRHEEAWNTLKEANRREFPRHQLEYQKQVKRMKAAHKAALELQVPAKRRGAASSQPLSLFILGPSRSGKSTIERLAAQLEGVKCGYESRLVEHATRRTSQLSGLLTIRNPADLPEQLNDRLRTIYLDEVRHFAGSAKILTSTYPAMIPYIGRIASVLPNVRFIFVRRDAYDCAFRILLKHYRAGNDYAYDVNTVFEYLSWYEEMAGIWMKKFPKLTASVIYEEAMAEPKAALGRISELCGAERANSTLPDLGDDRGCSRPYRKFIDAALGGQAPGLFLNV